MKCLITLRSSISQSMQSCAYSVIKHEPTNNVNMWEDAVGVFFFVSVFAMPGVLRKSQTVFPGYNINNPEPQSNTPNPKPSLNRNDLGLEFAKLFGFRIVEVVFAEVRRGLRAGFL